VGGQVQMGRRLGQPARVPTSWRRPMLRTLAASSQQEQAKPNGQASQEETSLGKTALRGAMLAETTPVAPLPPASSAPKPQAATKSKMKLCLVQAHVDSWRSWSRRPPAALLYSAPPSPRAPKAGPIQAARQR
jgi:hypothetical protein